MGPSPGNVVERVLAGVDAAPWGALYRVAIGFVLLPSFHILTRGAVSEWWLLAWFVSVLLALRLLPALLRRRMKVSAELSGIWLERRVLAKRYDSYQWRKLLWFGVGMGAWLAGHGHPAPAAVVLTVICLVGGAAGSVVFWIRGKAGLHAARLATGRPGRGS